MKKIITIIARWIICSSMILAHTDMFSAEKEEVGNVTDSIPIILNEVKNGDRSHMKTLAEAYRYGQGVEKSLINALISYDIADVDVVEETRKSYAENPNDEFAAAFILHDIYDKRCPKEALLLQSAKRWNRSKFPVK